MKTAKLFLFGMYLHLILSVFVPIHILIQGNWNVISITELWGYFFMIGVVQLIGWIYVGMSAKAYGQHHMEKIKKGWKLCKLGAIPFYILNFLYSFLFGFHWLVLLVGFYFSLCQFPSSSLAFLLYKVVLQAFATSNVYKNKGLHPLAGIFYCNSCRCLM